MIFSVLNMSPYVFNDFCNCTILAFGDLRNLNGTSVLWFNQF